MSRVHHGSGVYPGCGRVCIPRVGIPSYTQVVYIPGYLPYHRVYMPGYLPYHRVYIRHTSLPTGVHKAHLPTHGCTMPTMVYLRFIMPTMVYLRVVYRRVCLIPRVYLRVCLIPRVYLSEV